MINLTYKNYALRHFTIDEVDLKKDSAGLGRGGGGSVIALRQLLFSTAQLVAGSG